jgi:hypothetical protein
MKPVLVKFTEAMVQLFSLRFVVAIDFTCRLQRPRAQLVTGSSAAIDKIAASCSRFSICWSTQPQLAENCLRESNLLHPPAHPQHPSGSQQRARLHTQFLPDASPAPPLLRPPPFSCACTSAVERRVRQAEPGGRRWL